MLTVYNPPSRWWRRRWHITITLWPSWLAQRLCKHERAKIDGSFMGGIEWVICPDCYKLVDLTNL